MYASDASRRRNSPRRNPDKVIRAVTQAVAVLAIAFVGLILLSLTRGQVQADAGQPVFVSHVVSH
jgi:hypothetical protein